MDIAARLDDLERRLERIERLSASASAAAVPSPWAASSSAPAGATDLATSPASPSLDRSPPDRADPEMPLNRDDFEEWLGRHGLALAGGIAVLLGLGFLVALAANRGWIDERVRVVLAALASSGMVGAGLWLHQRCGRTPAGLATTGTGIAGLYLTLVAATAVYGLLPAAVGLGIAAAVGALATGIAIRLEAPVVAGLGILGALASPVLVAAPQGTPVIAFLGVALAASTAVMVWRRWEWLALAAFAVVTPQLAWLTWALLWRGELDLPSPAVFALFGSLHLLGALAGDRRSAADGPSGTLCLLVPVNALAVAALGALTGLGQDGVWVAGVASVHGLVGVAALARPLLSGPMALTLVGTGLTLGNMAYGMLADGAVLPAGWALSAAVLVLAGRWAASRPAASLTWPGYAAAAAQLVLAAGHVLRFEAPLGALFSGVPGGPAGLGEAATALAAIVMAAVVMGVAAPPQARIPSLALAGVALLYLASVTVTTLIAGQQGQMLLSALWAMTGLATLWAGLHREQPALRRAGFAVLAVALCKGLTYDVSALDTGYRVVSLLVLGLLLITGAFVYERLRPAGPADPAAER